MNPAISGADPTPQAENETKPVNGLVVSNQIVTAGIPAALMDYVRPDEDDDTSIRLPARDGNRRIGMLTIPNIRYPAWKTCFPKGMEKGPQCRYRESRRVFFSIDDLPAGTPTSITNGEASVFFSGFSGPIPAGEWIGNPPAELPVVTYAEITRLLGMQAEPAGGACGASNMLSIDPSSCQITGKYGRIRV